MSRRCTNCNLGEARSLSHSWCEHCMSLLEQQQYRPQIVQVGVGFMPVRVTTVVPQQSISTPLCLLGLAGGGSLSSAILPQNGSMYGQPMPVVGPTGVVTVGSVPLAFASAPSFQSSYCSSRSCDSSFPSPNISGRERYRLYRQIRDIKI